MVCELRRTYPRWGAQRIAHELTLRGVEAPPSRSSVYRILVRHGLVAAQHQNHERKYRRWQRDAPTQLWQIDIMGGVFLADGRECTLVTGTDDHAGFVVMATVVAEPGGRAVGAAFIAAMGAYGVPPEVLIDTGKQFTRRFTKPYPAEVLVERICRESGVPTHFTTPRSPTTTGKIERFHTTLRRELLDSAAPFASIEAAQEAIDAWVHDYNYNRPHQSLGMATPATVFRPAAIDVVPPMPMATHPLVPDIVEVVVPPRPKQRLDKVHPMTPGNDRPALPPGASGAEWETDGGTTSRVVFAYDREIAGGVAVLSIAAIQLQNGRLDNDDEPPHVYLQDVPDRGLTVSQARALALGLQEAADELDRWVADTDNAASHDTTH